MVSMKEASRDHASVDVKKESYVLYDRTESYGIGIAPPSHKEERQDLIAEFAIAWSPPGVAGEILK
jgi:hypothetical protein